MKATCEECKTERDDFNHNQRYCSPTCRIKAKNRELIQSWEKRERYVHDRKHPWRTSKGL